MIAGAAVNTTSAADRRGDDHPVTFSQVAHRLANLFHDAHGFVPQDPALFHARSRSPNKMQVSAAYRARRNANDGVRGLLQLWFWNIFQRYLSNAAKNDSFHTYLLKIARASPLYFLRDPACSVVL